MSFNINSDPPSFSNYLTQLQSKISQNPTGKAAQEVFDNIIATYEQLTLEADHLIGFSGERISAASLKPEDMKRFTAIASQLKNGILDKDDTEILIQVEQNFRTANPTIFKQEIGSEKTTTSKSEPFNWDNYVKALEDAMPTLRKKYNLAQEKGEKEYQKDKSYNEMRKAGSYISYGAAALSLGLAAVAFISGIGVPIALAAYALSIPFIMLGKKLSEEKTTPEYKQAILELLSADLVNFKTADLPGFKELVTAFSDKIKENNLSPEEANPIFRLFYSHIVALNEVKKDNNEKAYDILNLEKSEKEILSQTLQEIIDKRTKIK